MQILYKSQNIIIREFSLEDQSSFLGLFEDEEVARYIPRRSREEYLELFKASLDEYGKSPLGRWGIFDTRTKDFIGMYLVRKFEYIPDQIEIGYVLAKKYWGKGIASEASKALIAYCFSKTDTNYVVAVTDMDNISSQKVLQKVGLRQLKNLKRNENELAYFMIERFQR